MAARIRVAQVVTRFIAGAGGVALRGALALDSTRFSVTVLSSDGGPLLAEAERAGFEVIRLRHMRPNLNPAEDVRALLELKAEFRNRSFEIVHTHSSKAGALGRLAAHRVGVPAIVHTYHGAPWHEFQPLLRRSLYVAIERRLGRLTDHILAVGTATAVEALRYKIAVPERITVIASAIEPDLPRVSEATRAEARRRLGLPLEVQLVGTVGRLVEAKAPQDMVNAMALLARPDVFFVWVGDGPLRQMAEQLVKRRDLVDRFLFTGERTDVRHLLPGFDVFALSSRYEGLPCSLTEAMMCGIPVVATAVRAVPEVVIPGKTGLLVPPAQPASFARALAYTLDHPDEAVRMAAAARAHLGNRFHPETLGRDLVKTYERVLAGRSIVAPAAQPAAVT